MTQYWRSYLLDNQIVIVLRWLVSIRGSAIFLGLILMCIADNPAKVGVFLRDNVDLSCYNQLMSVKPVKMKSIITLMLIMYSGLWIIIF